MKMLEKVRSTIVHISHLDAQWQDRVAVPIPAGAGTQ